MDKPIVVLHILRLSRLWLGLSIKDCGTVGKSHKMCSQLNLEKNTKLIPHNHITRNKNFQSNLKDHKLNRSSIVSSIWAIKRCSLMVFSNRDLSPNFTSKKMVTFQETSRQSLERPTELHCLHILGGAFVNILQEVSLLEVTCKYC